MNNNALKRTHRASSVSSAKRHTGGQKEFVRAASHVKVLGGTHEEIVSEKAGYRAEMSADGDFAEDVRQAGNREIVSTDTMPVDMASESLGALLRTIRERRGMSIDELAREVHIAVAYVRALEEEDYRVFPAKVYAEGFLKRVAHVLIPEATEQCLAVLREHWDQEMGTGMSAVATTRSLRASHRAPFAVTPHRIVFGITGIFFVGVMVFLGVRVVSFLSPPRIFLESPREAETVSVPLIRVKGRVNQEGRLTVNNREVRMDESGNFNEEIEVGAGTNTLAFVAENKFGRRAEVVRHVVVK
ncbi:MAG: helix-turn-helix domain-containing protein [bacterium]|nr:helix-turn-helix domain-containing protein [bacterium]MDZ4299988.1 helix-turn-helix domain-containing protein [Candidatus Sungbacteria bacterium]